MVYLTFRSWYRSPTWWVWSLHGSFNVVDMSLQFWAKSVKSASVNLKFWTWNCSLVPARRVWYGIFNVNDRILQSRCLELKAWGSYQSGMVIIFDIHVTSQHGDHFGNRRFSNQFKFQWIFSGAKRIIDLFFNLFFLDATVNYCDANCSKKVHGVVIIYRLISRQPPFCVSTMLLIFLFTIRTLFSNLRFPISALYSLCKEAF